MGDQKYRANSTFDGLHAGEEFIGEDALWRPYVESGFVSPIGPPAGSSPEDVEPDTSAVTLEGTVGGEPVADGNKGEEPEGEG